MASGVLSSWNDSIAATGNALNYFVGQCTRWVAENLSWIPTGLGDAKDWLANAQAKGFQTGSTPSPGAVAVWGTQVGSAGHVAVVQSVDQAGGFVVSEENWLGSGIADTRSIASAAGSGIIGFIYPPGGAGGLPVIGGVVDAASNVASIGPAIQGLPASIGHGLANALSASLGNVGTFARNNIVALVVALVVAVMLFAV